MMSRVSRLHVVAVAAALLIAGCAGSSATTSPGGSASPTADGSSPSLTWTPAPTGPELTASPTPQLASGSVPLALVTGFTNYKVNGLTMAQLRTYLEAGKVFVPCGTVEAVATAVGATGTEGWAACQPVDRIAALIGAGSGRLALLPPGLVSVKMKAVPLDGADLFGEAPAREKSYPLTVDAPSGWKASWARYDVGDIRVVLTTGCTCPDRGVSHQTNVLKKGWDWLLTAGTAKYTGTHWDGRLGWLVVDAVRTDNEGAVHRLVRDADVAVSDFECAMTKNFTQHDEGTLFTIDPEVALFMRKAGIDVATIATDHMTNAGVNGLLETVDYFKKAGVKPVGGGRNLAEALTPAVIDVRGVKFGFVGFNAIGGSAYAGKSSPGVAQLTVANATKAIAAARAKGADVVFALPQWSAVEYTNAYTAAERNLASILFAAGADHVIGADHHWAAAISITPGGRSGNRYVTASQGNFWFGQDWSRQTMEGVMTMLTFQGTKLIQARLIPTVVLDNAQVNLVDPATDGQYVLKQVFAKSEIKPK
jgi:poly-gamma-glutamate capsule biosynthesis protein CapA/YwtB (metallophosphatase superfamily)